MDVENRTRTMDSGDEGIPAMWRLDSGRLRLLENTVSVRPKELAHGLLVQVRLVYGPLTPVATFARSHILNV